MSDETWLRQIVNEKSKYMPELFKYSDAYEHDQTLLTLIQDSVESAANRSLNAAYGGEHGDGGALASIRQLCSFLDGVLYAKTGKLAGPYAEVIRQIQLKEDPEYQKFLELKAKFEGKNAK